MDGLLAGVNECLIRGTPISAPCCKVLRTLGYLFTRLCSCISRCQLLNSRGVTGLVSQSVRALSSTVLFGTTPSAAMVGTVTLAEASFWMLEVGAK